MSELTEALTFVELFLLVGTLLWIVIGKRDLFDPRLYVLYGVFHWLFVAQLFYVFKVGDALNFELYEPTTFSDLEVFYGSLIVLLSTLFFLVGFSCAKYFLNDSHCSTNKLSFLHKIQAGYTNKYNYISLMLFVFSAGVVLLYDMGLNILPIPLLLPLGYFMPVATIFMVIALVYHHYCGGRVGLLWRYLFVVCLIYMMFATNIALIYPLIAIAVLIAGIYLPRFQRYKVALFVLISPIALFVVMTVQLGGKVYRRLLDAGVEIDVLTVLSNDSFYESLTRQLIRFDSFNVESFAVVMHAFRDFVSTGDYQMGATILSSIPVFKLLDHDIFLNFGRVMSLESLGVGEHTNTALAVSPVAEMAVNFSYAGPLFFYFFLGILSFCMYRWFRSSSSFKSVPVYICFLVWLFLQQRGDFLNGNMYPAYVFFMSYFVAHFFRKTYKTKAPLVPYVSQTE